MTNIPSVPAIFLTIANLETALSTARREYDALRAVSDGHNACKEAIRAALRPSKGIRLPSALLDGIEVTEVDVDAARSAQTLATRRAMKVYDARYDALKAVQTILRSSAGLAAVETEAARLAGRGISAYVETTLGTEEVLWMWPTEMVDAEEQASAAIGIRHFTNGIVLVDADRNKVGTASCLADALTVVGEWLSVQSSEESSGEWARVPRLELLAA